MTLTCQREKYEDLWVIPLFMGLSLPSTTSLPRAGALRPLPLNPVPPQNSRGVNEGIE